MALTQAHGQIDHHAERAWASITFSGARHTLKISFDGAEAVGAGEDFIAILPKHKFALPG